MSVTLEYGIPTDKEALQLRLGIARGFFCEEGIDLDGDLKIGGLGARYPNVVDLFGCGELAGAVLSEPNVSIGEGSGAFRVMLGLTEPAFCPDMQWSVVVAGLGILADEPELIRA